MLYQASVVVSQQSVWARLSNSSLNSVGLEFIVTGVPMPVAFVLT